MLTHYIVVRRDVPAGVALAQAVHAAGESFYLVGLRSSDAEHLAINQKVGPSQGSGGSTFNPADTRAVVLSAKNATELAKLHTKLSDAEVDLVSIIETDGEYVGQLMAIGLVPTDREDLRKLFNGFQMYTGPS